MTERQADREREREKENTINGDEDEKTRKRRERRKDGGFSTDEKILSKRTGHTFLSATGKYKCRSNSSEKDKSTLRENILRGVQRQTYLQMDFDDLRDNIKSWFKRYMFPVGLLAFQIIFVVLYGVHARYAIESDHAVNNHSRSLTRSGEAVVQSGASEFYYPFFQDVHVMMFIGFGFLMTFLRRYSFSSVSFNFLVAAFVLEWAILIRGYSFDWDKYTGTFAVSVKSLLHADFVCASVLISFGAVLGKTNPAQLVVMALIEVVIQVWNEYVGLILFCTYDAGE